MTTDGSPWAIFGKAGAVWTLVGLMAFYIAMRTPVNLMRRLAFPAFAVTIVLLLVLVLVPGIGTESNGTRGWFVIAGLDAALRADQDRLRHLGPPAGRAPDGTGLAEGNAGPAGPGRADRPDAHRDPADLGQTVSMGIILLALLWYAGLPLQVFLSSLLSVMVAGAVLAVSEGYRSDRVRSWLDPAPTHRARVTRPGRPSSRWPTAASSARAWVRAPRSGTTCPTRTTTSSSRSSARNSGLVGAIGLLACSACSPYTGMRIARAGRPIRSCVCCPQRPPCG